MKKRYFVAEGYDEMPFKDFLAVDEDDLVEKVILSNTVRVPKKYIENIEEYRIEGLDSDLTMKLEDAKEYLFLTLDKLTTDEIYYLYQEGYIYLEELELLEYLPNNYFDSLPEEDYVEWRDIIKKYLQQSIIAKMKAFGFEANLLDSYVAYIYWDGSMKEEDLSSDYSRWIDYTEELQEMKEIERKQEKTGHYTLYQLKDGSKVLVYTSYFQGKGEIIAFLPDVKTIDEAEEYIYQQEQEFFGSM